MNLDDRIEEFLKALKEGNFETPLGDFEVANDGECRLLIGEVPKDISGPPNCVSICLSDGGGFSSLYIDRENWSRIKIVVESLFVNMEGRNNDVRKK